MQYMRSNYMRSLVKLILPLKKRYFGLMLYTLPTNCTINPTWNANLSLLHWLFKSIKKKGYWCFQGVLSESLIQQIVQITYYIRKKRELKQCPWGTVLKNAALFGETIQMKRRANTRPILTKAVWAWHATIYLHDHSQSHYWECRIWSLKCLCYILSCASMQAGSPLTAAQTYTRKDLQCWLVIMEKSRKARQAFYSFCSESAICVWSL